MTFLDLVMVQPILGYPPPNLRLQQCFQVGRTDLSEGAIPQEALDILPPSATRKGKLSRSSRRELVRTKPPQ